MASTPYALTPASLPTPSAVLEILKPITWFPPMWALACGIVAAGRPWSAHWWLLPAGVFLAGPLLCGCSQAINDWFDREVDAINEPHRAIPSGRMPGAWGLYVAIAWSLMSTAFAWTLGPWVFGASLLGLALAWAYSAPPMRLKENGWLGSSACAFCYEGLPWITGSALMVGGGAPSSATLTCALLYSAGAVGIMTLNDFKSINGDRQMGLRSLPVQLGARRAARLACAGMALPQVAVAALLFAWGHAGHGLAVAGVLLAQCVLMRRWLTRPRELAPWYNATGVSLYVSGMMITAFALRAGAGA